MVLGICSIILYSVGLILGIIGLTLSAKGRKIHKQQPNNYSNWEQLQAGRVLSIISVSVWSIVIIAMIAFVISSKGGRVGEKEIQHSFPDISLSEKPETTFDALLKLRGTDNNKILLFSCCGDNEVYLKQKRYDYTLTEESGRYKKEGNKIIIDWIGDVTESTEMTNDNNGKIVIKISLGTFKEE